MVNNFHRARKMSPKQLYFGWNFRDLLHIWDSGFLESIIQWSNPPAARYHPWLSGPESTSDLSQMHMGCNCLELITVQ